MKLIEIEDIHQKIKGREPDIMIKKGFVIISCIELYQ